MTKLALTDKSTCNFDNVFTRFCFRWLFHFFPLQDFSYKNAFYGSSGLTKITFVEWERQCQCLLSEPWFSWFLIDVVTQNVVLIDFLNYFRMFTAYRYIEQLSWTVSWVLELSSYCWVSNSFSARSRIGRSRDSTCFVLELFTSTFCCWPYSVEWCGNEFVDGFVTSFLCSPIVW